jgi:hypothetical protein
MPGSPVACPPHQEKCTQNISTSAVDEEKEKKKKASPAISMAEASLLSQKAVILEQDSFKTVLSLQ